MAVGFVDPAACFCVCGEGFGVDALRGEHRDARGVGAEAGAVFADVGVRAGALGRGAQAVAAGEAGLDGRRFSPVVGGVSGMRVLPSGSGPMLVFARSRARSYSARTVWSNSRP